MFTIGECEEIPIEQKKRPLMERLNQQTDPIKEKMDSWGDPREDL